MGLVTRVLGIESKIEADALARELEALWKNALFPQLKELESIKEQGDKHNIGFNRNELENTRAKILQDFYARNRLAYEVSQGRDSYVELIKPIEDRYTGFWNLVTIPKLDDSFDANVKNVLSSIINVGMEGMLASSPNSFSTKERRRDAKSCRNFSAGMGILSPPFFLAAAIKYSDGLTPNEHIYLGIGSLLSFSIFYALTFFGGGGPEARCLGPPSVFDIKDELKNLHSTAEETDEYLRRNKL